MPDDRQAAKDDEKGLSELLAETFIIILSIVLVVIIVGAVTGIIPKMLQQSAFLAAKADFHTTAGGAEVISLFHQQGFAVSLNGSAQAGGITPVTFTLTTPDGVLVSVRSSPAITGDAWRPGDTVFIYQDGGRFFVTDDVAWMDGQGPGIAVPDADKPWGVNVIDTRTNILLLNLPVSS